MVLTIGVCFLISPQSKSDPFGSGRMTAQREVLIETAASMGCAFTVDDLAVAVRDRDTSIGVATVYRAVTALEETGWLERVGDRAGSALFARCAAGDRHHHHLICTTCGRVEPADCPIASASPHSSPDGFVITSHEVTLYGLCPDCVRAE